MVRKATQLQMGGGSKGLEDKTDDEGHEMVALPDHILMEEILPRLPVKSLVRFKSVSKYWLFTVSSNPDFAKLHLKFSSFHRKLFMDNTFSDPIGKPGRFFLLPDQEIINVEDLVGLAYGDNKKDLIDWFSLVNSCNGLVCLYCLDRSFLYDHDEKGVYREPLEKDMYCYFTVWNPATRQYRNIDTPPDIYNASAYGFGYVPSLDDYKIFASLATEYDGYYKFRGFYVFSLRDGAWKEIIAGSAYSSRSNEEKITIKLKDQGLLLGDTLYWPPGRKGSRKYILGVDLVNEELKEYTSMDWLSLGYSYPKLFRLKGRLALRNYGESHMGVRRSVYDIWMLNNCDDWSSWQKLFSVDGLWISNIIILEAGKCLARLQQSKQFKLVELSKEALQVFHGKGCSSCSAKVMDHVESLVSPFGMTNSDIQQENLKVEEFPIMESKLLANKRHSLSQCSKLDNANSESNSDSE